MKKYNYPMEGTKQEFLTEDDWKEYQKKIANMKLIRQAKAQISKRLHPAQMKMVEKNPENRI